MKNFDPKKSDLNKDGKLSSYEKKKGMAIAKNMSKGGPVLTKTRGTGAATKGLNFYRQAD